MACLSCFWDKSKKGQSIVLRVILGSNYVATQSGCFAVSEIWLKFYKHENVDGDSRGFHSTKGSF